MSNKIKLFYGIAYNSKTKYAVSMKGKPTKAYTTWYNMIQRCYCPKIQERCPTYIGCAVSDEWLDYQCFAEWFYSQTYRKMGYQLDKDILFRGNKLYSPSTCCLVPAQINSLLLNCAASRGDLPQGIYLDKRVGKFVAMLRVKGKREFLGQSKDLKEVQQLYKSAKERHVKDMALEYKEQLADNVFDALMKWKVDGDWV